MTTTADKLKNARDKKGKIPTPSDFFENKVNTEEKPVNIVDNEDNDSKETPSPDIVDTVDNKTDVNMIKAESLPKGLKVSQFFKILNESENREQDERVQGFLPSDMLRTLNRLAYKLSDVAALKGNKRKVGISTVLKILITEAASRVESYIDKERDKLLSGEE